MVKARLTGVTNKELEETYGRLEETGGCGRRMLGLLAGGGPADVAGWVDGWQLEETGRCGRRILGPTMGGGPADVAGYRHLTSSLGRPDHRWVGDATTIIRAGAVQHGPKGE